MTSVRDGGCTQVRLGYDAAGRRSWLDTGPNGATAATSYQYDAVGRLKRLTHDLAGPGSDQTLEFTYNPASQIVTRWSGNGAYDWAPPAVDHSYRSNGLNQYVEVGPNPYAYDSNGNLRSDGITGFVYDSENRLVSATGPNNNVILSYDPLGRLWQVWGATGKTQFVYDGDDRIFEFDGFTNGALRAYAHGPGPDEPLILYEAGAGRRFYRADHQGSIVALVDDAGVAVATNAYDPWGMPRPGNYGRFGYTGQTWLPELGMNYYKARFYSPMLGRFLQTDPIGYEGGTNLYAYVENDPVNDEDPTGNAPWLVKVAVDFGLEVGIQYLETGKVNLSQAARNTAAGLVNPLRTLERARDLGRAIRAAQRAACCFAAETAVLTEKGPLPIVLVEVGDRVWSSNPETGEAGWRAVTQLYVNDRKPIWNLTIVGPNGTETHRVTDNHPYWVASLGWTEVRNLRPGMMLSTKEGGHRKVSKLENTGKVETTYNLEVEELHSFYVGPSHILVHNGCRPGEFSRGVKQAVRREQPNCERCGGSAVPGVGDRKGVPPATNRSEIHHRKPLHQGGTKERSNAENLCRKCHLEEHQARR